MKKITLILLAICMIACDRGPKPKYTISVRILDGSTGSSALYKNQAISIEATSEGNFKSYREVLGTTTSNDTGWFTITYEETKLKGYTEQVRIFGEGDQWQISDLPLNQDILGRIYQSSYGTLKIFLQTQIPLEQNHDTLYIGYLKSDGGAGYVLIGDTITSTINGYYKTYRLPASAIGIHYGRGYKAYGFDQTMNRFKASGNDAVIFKIEGDPIINEGTINY
jgi:hypothetical protein